MRRVSQGAIAHGRASPWASYSAIVALAALLLALYAGRAIGTGQLSLLLLLLAAVIGLVLFDRLSLSGWCGLILISTVAARGPVMLLGLPSLLNFVHYPIVVAFAAAAITRRRSSGTRVTAGRWVLGLIVVSAISLVTNLSHPLRALIFLVIVGEPLVVIWAMQRWGPDAEAQRRLGRLTAALLIVQIPIGIGQGLTLGWQDPVQGTLTGHGNGHHILGGLFALALFLAMAALLSRRISRSTALLIGATCIGMMMATGAMQVVFAASFALVALPLVTRTNPLTGASRTGRRGSRLAAAVFALVLSTGGLVLAEAIVPGIIERAAGLANLKELPETELLADRASSHPTALLVGSGPGTSASRASILLNPELQKEDSPLAALDLPPTELGREVIFKTRDPYGGSAEQFSSSALAVIGDLGLIGVVGLVLLFLSIWRAAGRHKSWLMPAAQASLLMTGVLMFIESWLEYPEFSVPLALLLGFATTPRTSAGEDEQEAPSATAAESGPDQEAVAEDERAEARKEPVDLQDAAVRSWWEWGRLRAKRQGTGGDEERTGGSAAEVVAERQRNQAQGVSERSVEPPDVGSEIARTDAEAEVEHPESEAPARPPEAEAVVATPERLTRHDEAAAKRADELERLASELQRVEAWDEAAAKSRAERDQLITELNAERRKRKEAELAAERQRLEADLGAERERRRAVELEAEREQLLARLEAARRAHEQATARQAEERDRLLAQFEGERQTRQEAAAQHAEERQRLVAEFEAERQKREEAASERQSLLEQLEMQRQKSLREIGAERQRLITEFEAERQKREQADIEHAEERQRLITEFEAERQKREQADVQHAEERQRLVAEIEAERQRRDEASVRQAEERQRLVSQLEAEREKREQAAAEQAEERQRLVAQIEAEREKREQAAAEQAEERQRLVAQIEAEREKRKEIGTQRRQAVGQLGAERRKRKEAAGEHAAERRRLIAQLEAETNRRDEAEAEHAAERQRLMAQLEAEAQRRDEAEAEHAAERQRLIAQLEAERSRPQRGAQLQEGRVRGASVAASPVDAARDKEADASTPHPSTEKQGELQEPEGNGRRAPTPKRSREQRSRKQTTSAARKDLGKKRGEVKKEKQEVRARARVKPAEKAEQTDAASGRAPRRAKSPARGDDSRSQALDTKSRRRGKREEVAELVDECWGAPEDRSSNATSTPRGEPVS